MAAYAAVASLLQTLDNLMRISIGQKFQGCTTLTTRLDQSMLPGFLLEAEKIQRMFIVASDLHSNFIQWYLSPPFSSYARPSSGFGPMFNSDFDLFSDLFSDLEPIIPVTPELNKLECFESYFMGLLRYGQWAAHQVEVIENCMTFNKTVTVLCGFYAYIRCLYQDLWFMLTCLDDFANIPDDLLNRMRGICEKAKDDIEEYTMTFEIESAVKNFIERLLREKPIGIRRIKRAKVIDESKWDPVYEEFLASRIDKKSIARFFGTRMGVARTLARALKEIKPIKPGMTSNCRNMNVMIASLKVSSVSLREPKEEVLVGSDDQQLSILEGLTGAPSGLEIVSIVGMGGIGKTTLAKALFNHCYVCYHFDCRAWISVSPVYIVRDMLLGLLSSLAQRYDKINDKSNAELAESLYRSLKGRRYLVVMDDMWSIDAWNDVKRCFPDDKTGSRIIVTSRLRELANQMAPDKAPHCMDLLDAERSWELLRKLVFGNANRSPELEEVGEQIAKRCGGLPLAIVVIAGVLSCTIRTIDSWKHIAENLSSTVATTSEQCLDILALSYIYLPHHLRACFLYMGAFPEDCEINAQKLINLWVAEGFLRSDSPRNLEQIGEDYLEDLIDRNLVRVEKRHLGGKVKTCRLHDFVKELCLREALKENFMNVIQRRVRKKFPECSQDQRRIIFHLDPYIDVTETPRLPRLSSFMCFSLGSNIIPDILFSELGFKMLRVLDIYYLHFEYFPELILKLIHLRYLALKVTFELPSTMSQLRNLQTFVIQGPWLHGSNTTLFLKYWIMPSLRHLHSSVAIQLENPDTLHEDPQRLVLPEYLQTLSKLRSSSCTREVFAVMPSLKRLQICETKDDFCSDGSCALLNNLVHLRELEILKCCFYQQNGEPRGISCLYTFPLTLKKLSLSWSNLLWEEMRTIATLPKLQVLKLKNYAFRGPKWMPIEVGFPSLKYLLIDNTNLVYWEASVDQYPCLEKLILKSCKQLKEIPFEVDAIGSLQQMEVHYCSYPIEILAKDFQERVDGIDVVIRSDSCRSQHNVEENE